MKQAAPNIAKTHESLRVHTRVAEKQTFIRPEYESDDNCTSPEFASTANKVIWYSKFKSARALESPFARNPIIIVHVKSLNGE
jgi:hypothetical protein